MTPISSQPYDKHILQKALQATAQHRGTAEQIADTEAILKDISENSALQVMWNKYRQQFAYAKGISYDQIMQTLAELCAPAE